MKINYETVMQHLIQTSQKSMTTAATYGCNNVSRKPPHCTTIYLYRLIPARADSKLQDKYFNKSNNSKEKYASMKVKDFVSYKLFISKILSAINMHI
jgi:hypothetical protein